MPAAFNDPGEWGTEPDPLTMSPLGWELLHPWLKDRMQHVHVFDGFDHVCVRNRFAGEFCEVS